VTAASPPTPKPRLIWRDAREVAEALSVAIAMNTGAAVGYSARVMDAFAVFSSKD
jgi:hypothetical protein